MIAIGHLDGCVSFWATDDDDRPLAVRTMSEPFAFIDVHVPDPMALIEESENGEVSPQIIREPVFKLAWSGVSRPEDQSGDYGAYGPSQLYVLGGVTSLAPSGIVVLHLAGIVLPIQDPASAAATSPNATRPRLPPSTRQALKTSLFPSESALVDPCTLIPCPTPVDDFLLLPQVNPYLNGMLDPVGVIRLSSSPPRKRSILATFPISDGVVAFSGAYSEFFQLPPLLAGSYAPPDRVMGGLQILGIESRQTFTRLVTGGTESTTSTKIPCLRGGSAWTDSLSPNAPDTKLAKVRNLAQIISSKTAN